MTLARKIGYVVLAFAVFALAINTPGIIEGQHKMKAFRLVVALHSHALGSRDYAAAYALGDEAFRNAITLETFSAQQRAFESDLGRLLSVDAQNFYVHGKGSPTRWVALVEEQQRYERGALQFACEFHLENETWRLFGCKKV